MWGDEGRGVVDITTTLEDVFGRLGIEIVVFERGIPMFEAI